MKVAIYTIAKNEAKHVSRWLDSTADADYHLVADTGSTDGTAALLRDAGVGIAETLTIRPWRFDVARNAVLAMLPADTDWAIACDMDEVMMPGWRDVLEAIPLDWDGVEVLYKHDVHKQDQWMQNQRIHKRFGWYWKYSCHECLYPEDMDCHIFGPTQIVMEHRPDLTKDRSQYLPLLEHAATGEFVDDPRMNFFYARELCYAGQYDKAIAYFRRAGILQLTNHMANDIEARYTPTGSLLRMP